MRSNEIRSVTVGNWCYGTAGNCLVQTGAEIGP